MENVDKEGLKYLETFYDNYLHAIDYDTYKKVYSRHYSIGYISGDLNDKLTLISLVAFLTNIAKKKSPDATVYKVLKKVLIPEQDDYYLKALCVLTEDLMYGCSTFDSCGLKSFAEMSQKINELYKKMLPF